MNEIDSRSFAVAAQLAAQHLQQDPVLFANWDVRFELTFVMLNDTKDDGVRMAFARTPPGIRVALKLV